MLLGDLMKVRYGKDWRDVPKNNDVTPSNADPKAGETLCQEDLKPCNNWMHWRCFWKI